MTRRRLLVGLRLVAGGAVIVLAVLLVRDLMHPDHSVARSVQQGKIVPAPNFRLPRLNGTGKLQLAALRGKAVVLNYWASDCGPCKQEMPRLEAAARRYAGRVVFVGVDVEDVKGPARAFLTRYGVTYPIVFDQSGSTVGPYGVIGTPQTFFVDRRGRLVSPHVLGPVSDKSLAAGIRRALGT